jgi:hypothetical protein
MREISRFCPAFVPVVSRCMAQDFFSVGIMLILLVILPFEFVFFADFSVAWRWLGPGGTFAGCVYMLPKWYGVNCAFPAGEKKFFHIDNIL